MWKASIFKIVRLAATWKNFRGGHEKMLKMDVFHKTLISRNLLKEAHIQARSMWKLTSRAFRKCGTYWAYQVLNGSYCWSKSDGFEILAPSAKIRGVTKKRHGHNFEFWAVPLNQRWTNHVTPTLIQFQAPKIEIVAVSFFCDAPFLAKFVSEFDPTLTANNYGLKPDTLNKSPLKFVFSLGFGRSSSVMSSSSRSRFEPFYVCCKISCRHTFVI